MSDQMLAYYVARRAALTDPAADVDLDAQLAAKKA